MAHFWAVAPHFIIHLRHEDVLPPESLWQLAQGTHDINVKSGWISDNKWYENIARFGLIRSKKKKKKGARSERLSDKRRRGMSASLHISRVIRQIWREGDPILTTAVSLTKGICLIYLCCRWWHPLAARARCEISAVSSGPRLSQQVLLSTLLLKISNATRRCGRLVGSAVTSQWERPSLHDLLVFWWFYLKFSPKNARLTQFRDFKLLKGVCEIEWMSVGTLWWIDDLSMVNSSWFLLTVIVWYDVRVRNWIVWWPKTEQVVSLKKRKNIFFWIF